MKHMLNLYFWGVVLTLLSFFFGLMESLECLLEGPLPESSWTTRGQLANSEPPKGLPNHSSQPRGGSCQVSQFLGRQAQRMGNQRPDCD
ncbi:hypoxia-inducible lipid droplet-associated protein [Rhynchocyon petersi]